MKKATKIVWGALFIIAGILIAIDVLGIADIGSYVFFDGWWTLFIIVPFAVSLFTEGFKAGNIIGLLVGVALLLSSLDIVPFDILFKLLVPFIIIAIGISLIFGGRLKKAERAASKKIDELKQKNAKGTSYAAVFSGQDLRFVGDTVEGLTLDAVFGGIECDLRGAIIEKDIVIDATAIFGGIDIFVPMGYAVKVKSTSLFGGVSNEVKYDVLSEKPTIYVNGSGIFGGVTIK